VDRKTLLQQWTEAETKGLWAGAWSKCVAEITATQAAWKPDPKRHSIWQLVNHISFWREHELRNLAGKKPDDAEVSRRNWEEPTDASADAWSTARTRLSDTHRQIAEALENEHEPLDRLKYLLPHDCYHFGQIMYVRALQGLPSID